jgi:hypothetical protein
MLGSSWDTERGNVFRNFVERHLENRHMEDHEMRRWREDA